MFGFSSYHWPVDELSEEDRRAVAAIDDASPDLPTAGHATHDPGALFAAFRTLLHSADLRARGVALDQYTYTEAQGRWSVENPLVVFDDEVRAVARELLALEPDGDVPVDVVVAGWQSALGVLTHLADGDASDLPRIVAILDAMAAEGLLEPSALWTVEVRLADADPQTRELVVGWLASLARDEKLDRDLRVQALQTLGDERAAHRATIEGLLGHTDLRLAIEAAQMLIDLDPSAAPRVRQVFATWPPDAPYPASEVRYRLEELDELARARAALAAPDPETVDFALQTVAEHGTPADLPAVLAAIDVAPTDAFADAVVHCLRAADDEAARATYATLSTVYTDGQRPAPVRVLALRPFWRRPEHQVALTPVTELLNHDDLTLATAAALALAGRPGTEAAVRAAAERWPDDAPYPAERVRDTLAEHEELAAARAVLEAPAEHAELLDAVSTVTFDGDASDGPRLLALAAGASDRRLMWKLRTALLRRGDRADPRYAEAVKALAARLISG